MKDELQINIHGVVEGRPVRKCPKCGEMKDLNEFGLRNKSEGVVANQSWCRGCRNPKTDK